MIVALPGLFSYLFFGHGDHTEVSIEKNTNVSKFRLPNVIVSNRSNTTHTRSEIMAQKSSLNLLLSTIKYRIQKR